MLLRLTNFCNSVNDFLWGPFMLALFLFVGLLFSVGTGFFQIRHFRIWWHHTASSLFRKKEKSTDKKSISQVQALSAVLAATVGTGNITGVAAALVSGGPGAIFWMWISAFLGMMTAYAENVLGILYRRKKQDGTWAGGAMYYMEHGLHLKPLAVLFALFGIPASLGMGNMAQMDSIAAALSESFGVPPLYTAIFGSILVAVCIRGGLKKIVCVTEKLVPFMVILFFLGSGVCLFCHAASIPSVLMRIISDAFSLRAASGGALGYGITKAMRVGISRGVFSNEAGLGTSVSIHASADVKHPCEQGLWGIFEVFVDTILVCTITALVILTSGAYDAFPFLDGVPLTAAAYSITLGQSGSLFISISTVFFAFATILGWSIYGENSVRYLFGKKALPYYKGIYILSASLGALGGMELIWGIADMANGLMAIPNLLALLFLSGQVIKETRAFLRYY